MSKVLMSEVKNSNLKIVDQQHEEAVRHEEEEKISELTPAEGRARAHEIRRYLEKFKDGLEGVPFDAVAHTPGESIRNIDFRGDVETSIGDLVEHLNPFIKDWREHCKDLEDEFGFLI